MSGRLEKIKRMALEDLLNVNPDYAATGYAHLSYAACLGALLARKRGCDMELCQAAGFLHDVWLHERAQAAIRNPREISRFFRFFRISIT